MTTYTLHVPKGARPGDPEALERAEIVKDGFNWGAFIFTVFWFLLNRLWLAAFAVLVVIFAFAALLEAIDVHPLAAVLAQLLLGILIGLEASSLKRWTYARAGKPAAMIVSADTHEDAERKAFALWLAGTGSTPAPARAAPARPGPAAPFRASEPVIGLFPDAERPR